MLGVLFNLDALAAPCFSRSTLAILAWVYICMGVYVCISEKRGVWGGSNLWNLKCKSPPVGVEAEQISIYKVGKRFNVFEGVGQILSPIWGKKKW